MNSYQQFCGVAKALDLLGERWTLLILRDLLLGPRRYSDLLCGLRGITTNLLAKRLKQLTFQGLIEACDLPGTKLARGYQLTNEGRAVEPVVLALGAFGARYMAKPSDGETLDPRWAMLSLKRRYRGSLAAGRVAFQVADQHFAIEFDGERIAVSDGHLTRPDATLHGAPTPWFALLTRQASLQQLLSAESLHVQGRKAVLNSLCKALELKLR